MAPGFIFLANRGNLTKTRLYKTIQNRLSNEAGCANVRHSPSRLRPRRIEADVDPTVFFGQSYPVDDAGLSIEFTYPRDVDHEYYVIEWIEEMRDLGFGWHQDELHPDLDECHYQLDHEGTTIERDAASFIDAHPLNVLEARLDQLRTVIPALDWSGAHPTVPDDIPEPSIEP